MTYNPNAPIVIKVEVYLGATLGWTDVTTRGRSVSCVITAGRSADAIDAETSQLALVLGNADGWLTEDNPVSPWYPYFRRGCPIRVSRIGLTVSPAERFHGQIDRIVGRYPGGNADSTVEVSAIGMLGILAKGTEPIASAMTRGIPQDNPLAWWPLELSAASGLSGGQPLAQAGQVVFGAAGDHPGSLPLPDYSAGGRLTGSLPNGSSSSSWRLEFTARFGTGSDTISDADFTIPVRVTSPAGTVNSWEFLVSTGFACFDWIDTAGAYTDGIFTTVPVDDGLWHHFRADVAQSGGNIAVALTVDGVVIGTKTIVGKTLNSTGSKIGINPDQEKETYVGTVGQVAWWSPHAVTAINTAVLATGNAGETAAARMVRLCAESGVAFVLTGTASETPAMGPQLSATLIANLLDCAETDQGLLHDFAANGAAGYVTTRALCNQTANIAVVQGSIEPDLATVWDNRYATNDVTSTRPSGGSGHASDEAHVALTGARLKADRSPNVLVDAQLDDDAGWAVRVGTAPGARYNSLGINLRNADGALLADAVAAHQIGDRLTVASTALPAQHPIGGIDGVTVGWTEVLDEDTWIFRANVQPYQPYEVFILADQTRGRIDTAGSQLAGGISTTAISMSVTTSSGPLWITTATRPGDFPFDIIVAGERVRVTAVTGASSPQTFTIVRSVNGVVKAQTTGATVSLWRPTALAL